jgi:hypothetical protein
VSDAYAATVCPSHVNVLTKDASGVPQVASRAVRGDPSALRKYGQELDENPNA